MRVINNVAMILCFFPWVSFGLIEGGVQPYFLLLTGFIVFVNMLSYQSFKKEQLLYVIPVSYFLIAFLGTSDLKVLFRDFAGYLVVPVCYIFFKNYLSRYGFPRKIIIICAGISIAAGIIQFLTFEKIFEFITHSRTTSTRGFTGLASEPSFYGMHLVFLGALLMFHDSRHLFMGIGIAISGVVLSMSFMSVMFFFTVIPSVLILKDKISLKILIGIFMTLIIFIAMLPSDNRLKSLIFSFYNNGITKTIDKDPSATKRFSKFYTPFYLSYENSFLPIGRSVTDQLSYLSKSELEELPELVNYDNKIGSYSGRYFYHFGLIAILPTLFLFLYLLILGPLKYLAVFILIFILMLFSISPLYPVIIFFLSLTFFSIKENYGR